MIVTSFSLDVADVNELSLQLAHQPTATSQVMHFRDPSDVAWAASHFLARLIRRASPTHPRLVPDRAEQILSDVPNAPSLGSLEQRSWVRVVLGRLEIPSGIAFMLRRDGEDVLSPDERAALKALYAARYTDGPPFWIPRSLFDPIHASHRAAHAATPGLEELVRDRFIEPSALHGEDGFLLPLQRSTESKPWQRLGSRVAAALWIALLHDAGIPSDTQRLASWIPFIEHIHDVVDALLEMDHESLDRLLDAALEVVLAEPDLQDPSREVERIRWESELGARGQWDPPAPPGPDSTMLARWRWWDVVEDGLIRSRCRDTIDALIATIVHFDGMKAFARVRCERIMTLLRASGVRPHLAWEVGLHLSLSRVDPVAWLATEADLAPFGMAILMDRAMPETVGYRRLDFDGRTAATEARRTALWTSTLRVAVSATADEDDQRFVAIADSLLVLATSLHGPSRRRAAPSKEHEARLRASLEIVSGRTDLVHDRALRVMRERVELAARAAIAKRPQFESLPLAALTVLFLLFDLGGAAGGTVIDEISETIVELYAREIERLLYKDGSNQEPVHWVDFSPALAALRWSSLISRGTPRASRLLRPVDFAALARSAGPTARSLRGDDAEAAKLSHPLITAAIRKARTHLALLCAAHRALSNSRAASDVAAVPSVEEAIVGILETCVAGDSTLDIPSLFADDIAYRFGGDDRPKMASGVVDTLNRFAEDRRGRAFGAWIAAETLPTILLVILAEAIPAAARERVQVRLRSVDLASVLGKGLWLPDLEQMIDAALDARDVDLAKRLLELGDARVNSRTRGEWERWAFSKRLIVAYLAKDAAMLESVPAPTEGGIRYVDAIDPQQTRDFYRALLLLETAPEQAREIFDAQLRSRPELVSHAVNRLAADIRAALAVQDAATRADRIEHALRAWADFAERAPKESLERVTESVAFGHLSAFDQLRRDVDFDRTWDELDAPLQRTLPFVTLAVTNARRREMQARAGQLLAVARPYHLAPDGKPTADFVGLEEALRAPPPNDAVPIVVTRSAVEVARLRSQYREEIMNLGPRDLVRVVGGGQELDGFLFGALVLALQEMLDRSFILQAPNEDRYSDLVVSLLRMQFSPLTWNVRDQSRGGQSVGGKDAGRRDWVVASNKGMALALFEALCLDSVKTAKINEHVEKLATRYDPLGLAQGFIVVYASVNDRDGFWKNYCAHITSLAVPGFEITADTSPDLNAELPYSLRACRVTYAKDGLPYLMYHVVVFVTSTLAPTTSPS